MTRPVAEYLTSKVFCILDDPKDDSQRVEARDLGSGSKIYQLISQILTFLVTNGLSPPARHKASRLQRPFRRLGVPRQDKRILIRMSMQQARAHRPSVLRTSG